MTWHEACPTSDIPANAGHEVLVAGRVIAIFRDEQGFLAVDGMCAHQGGPIAQGAVSGNCVTCPWHGWQFDATSGQHCLNATLCQQSYTVELVDGIVCVHLP